MVKKIKENVDIPSFKSNKELKDKTDQKTKSNNKDKIKKATW